MLSDLLTKLDNISFRKFKKNYCTKFKDIAVCFDQIFEKTKICLNNFKT